MKLSLINKIYVKRLLKSRKDRLFKLRIDATNKKENSFKINEINEEILIINQTLQEIKNE